MKWFVPTLSILPIREPLGSSQRGGGGLHGGGRLLERIRYLNSSPQVFKKLHLGSVSYGQESMAEVCGHSVFSDV